MANRLRIHILVSGQPLCGFSRRQPSEWPLPHTFLSLHEYSRSPDSRPDDMCPECEARTSKEKPK